LDAISKSIHENDSIGIEVLESSGIYFYQVVIDGMGVKTGKLVKE
jgi:hypothetical protein